jgi:hypothetical protein
MIMNLWKRWAWCGSEYLKAKTIFQVHSPFVFDFCQYVLEDSRKFYAFDDIRLKIMQHHGAPAVHYRQGLFFFRISQWFQADNLVLPPDIHPVLKQILILGNKDSVVAYGNDERLISNVNPDSGKPGALLLDGSSSLYFFPEPISFLQFLNSEASHHSPKRCLYLIDKVASDSSAILEWERIKTEAPDSVLTLYAKGVGLVYTGPEVMCRQDFTLIRYRYKPWAFYDFF